MYIYKYLHIELVFIRLIINNKSVLLYYPYFLSFFFITIFTLLSQQNTIMLNTLELSS